MSGSPARHHATGSVTTDPSHRWAFILPKVYELTYPEIAARLNLTVADVENLLTHAVLKINEGSDAKKSGS